VPLDGIAATLLPKAFILRYVIPAMQVLTHAALLAKLAAPYPFTVGETLRYDAKLGYFSIGTASVSVARLAQERGTETFVFTGSGEGGPPGWRVRYDLTSWVSTGRFHSLRFHRRLVQGSKTEDHRYVIVPDSGRYREESAAGDWVTPPEPLDELAFLYYLRATPLEVGKTYSLDRYFRTGYNPVQVHVAGREPVAMPGGTTASCLAVRITSRGMTMRAWLTDDARRIPAQMEIPLPFGSVTLTLVSSISPDNYRSPSG
jgi:hypothetical protein